MRKILCFLAIACGFSSSPGVAQDLKVVASGDFPPYYYASGNGEAVGMTVEIVQATLAQANLQTKIEPCPVARALKLATDKADVLIFTIFRTPEREAQFKWVAPVTPPIRSVLFKLAKRGDINLKTVDDAKRYKIGVVRGNNLHEMFSRHGFDQQLEPVAQNVQNIRKLFAERIDLCAGRELPFATEMKPLGLDRKEVTTALALNEDLAWMAFSKPTSDALVERVRKAFEQIKAKGIVDNIIKNRLREAAGE